MKILHASIPADNPQRTAQALAAIMDGEAMPFPPGGPDSWVVWSNDGATEVEIVWRGNLLVHEEDQGNLAPGRGGAVAFRMSSGDQCHPPRRRSNRHGTRRGLAGAPLLARWGYFDLIEVWVDGSFGLELLDPAQAAHYARVVTPRRMETDAAQMAAA